MKKFIIFLILVIFFLTFFSCKITKKEILKVGVISNYPPFSYKENDKFVGFNIDFLNLLLKKLNYEGELIETEPFNFDPLLKNEVRIMIGGYPIKYKYINDLSLSQPYFDLSYYLISRTSYPIDSIDSLQDKRVILPLYTIAEELVKNVKNLEKIPYKNFNEAINSLENDEVDAILIEKVTLDINKVDENKFFIAKVHDNGLTIVLRDEDNDLRYKINGAISEIIKGKDYKKLILKWFEEER
jgi:polar amino acid transport system substrate-binding protein